MLTDVKLCALKPKAKVYRMADDVGLCVQVHPSGARYWRLRYRHAGKQKMLSLGKYPETSLSAARVKRDDTRKVIAEEVDPSTQRKMKRLTAHLSAETAFEPVAREWLAGRGTLAHATWTKLEWMLGKYAYPFLGTRPVGDISAPELLALLRRIESLDKLETAQRLKQVWGPVFRYAIATGRAERDPSADLRGALKTIKTRHHASITDPVKVGELLRALEGFAGSLVVSCALKLAPLVFVRPGELLRAEWSEIDLDAALWRIPGDKMKIGRDTLGAALDPSCGCLARAAPIHRDGSIRIPGHPQCTAADEREHRQCGPASAGLHQ